MALPPGSPQETASVFVGAILKDRDLRTAWPLLDEPFRRDFAADFVDSQRDNAAHEVIRQLGAEHVVDGLAVANSQHPMWPPFEQVVLQYFRERWADVDLATWNWAMDPRLVGVGEELVLLVDHPAGVTKAKVAVRSLGFLLRHADGRWLLTGFDERALRA